jgi:hypothetical protein
MNNEDIITLTEYNEIENNDSTEYIDALLHLHFAMRNYDNQVPLKVELEHELITSLKYYKDHATIVKSMETIERRQTTLEWNNE